MKVFVILEHFISSNGIGVRVIQVHEDKDTAYEILNELNYFKETNTKYKIFECAVISKNIDSIPDWNREVTNFISTYNDEAGE